jgi:death-on-curing family protein
MTKRLQKTPRIWLNLSTCERIFGIFREKWEYDEPMPDFDTRFPGRLESIVESVRQTFGRKYLNPTVLDAAAAYFGQLVRGHAFENGNKRMGVLFTHIFLLANGVDLTLTAEDLYNLAVMLARVGEKRKGEEEIKEWCKGIFRQYCVDVPGKKFNVWGLPIWKLLPGRKKVGN